jgi:hypothetical protein
MVGDQLRYAYQSCSLDGMWRFGVIALIVLEE